MVYVQSLIIVLLVTPPIDQQHYQGLPITTPRVIGDGYRYR